MILRPVELEMEGFRSFADKTLIKFPQVERGAILINGTYKDGTTSSGSGKSSILMAMAFALGFCDVPATELKSWYSKKLNVRFRLSDGANTYDIIRDPKLKLIVNGAEYEGTATGAEEKLQEILKASPDLVKALTYRPQREKGFFLSKTDAKIKEFLTKVLNLESVEDAVDDFSRELSEKNTQIQILEGTINQMKAQVEQSYIPDEQVEAAQVSYREASERLQSLQGQNNASGNIQVELSSIEAELNKIQKAIFEVNSATQQNLGIRQKIESIQIEIKKLQSGVCPTCDREWDKFHARVEQKNNDIMVLLESMKSNLAIIKNAEPLVNEGYRAQLTERKAALHSELGKLAAPMNDAIQAEQFAKSNLQNLLRMKDNLNNTINALSLKEDELKKAKIEAHVLEGTCSMLGRQGFLGTIFDEVLSEIKNRSNDLMSYMPNINTFSIDISSTSTTQKGKVNKKIKTSLYKDGVEKSIKTLSGGQTAGLELCTDLAVSETIRARSGSNLGWVALDEAMDGLDVETKMAALEIIKSKVNGLLIVVDHSTEIKEAFDTVVEVEYDGKKSYVAEG